MNKPKVFQNKINKNINNNKEYSLTRKNEINNINEDINTKINNIFNSKNYIYKIDTIITLKDKVVEKRIIGKKNNNLLTMDNELISFDDIIDIKIKSKN